MCCRLVAQQLRDRREPSPSLGVVSAQRGAEPRAARSSSADQSAHGVVYERDDDKEISNRRGAQHAVSDSISDSISDSKMGRSVSANFIEPSNAQDEAVQDKRKAHIQNVARTLWRNRVGVLSRRVI